MGTPQIIISGVDNGGLHSADLRATRRRLREARQYKDTSTVIVIPTRGAIPARAVDAWMNLQAPMNGSGLPRVWMAGFEVGDAYEQALDFILKHPVLKTFKYVLTLEEDNLPPPTGVLDLLKTICDCDHPCKTHFVQVAGLYFTKGEAGQPMLYGDPKGILGFMPQIPLVDKVQEVNGTGMGFTLFHLGLFRDEIIERPWFTTKQDASGAATQDLYFMAKVRRAGYRIASDNRVRVGHLDPASGIVW